MNSVDLLPLIKESIVFFLFTMTELSVLFVGISFLVGLINEFLPQDKVKKLLAGGNGRGYLIGSLLGGLTPFCSCSTIPITVGLLRAQAGFGPTMAFLFTSPLINPIIIPLFFTLLGLQVTLVYMAVAICMALVISYLLHRLGFSRHVRGDIIGQLSAGAASCDSWTTTVSCCTPLPQHTTPLLHQAVPSCCDRSAPTQRFVPLNGLPMYRVEQSRWRRIFSDAVNQFRKLLPFVVLGVGIGSIIHGFLPADLVVRLAGADNPLAVPASALIGIPLYLRASTMVPIAASLVAKGMSMGAVVALIIGGAGASLPEVAMLKGIFRLPLLIAFLCSVMIMAVSAGWIVNALPSS